MRVFNRTSLFRILLQSRAHTDLDRIRDQVLQILTERHGEEDVTCITQDAILSTLSSIFTALTLATPPRSSFSDVRARASRCSSR